jgi:hypothetical protein
VVNTTATEWFRGLWRFYLAYTKTSVHAAAAAGLAIFGLLVFVDDTFAFLAIASYVLPPVILYVVADDPVAEYGPDDASTNSVQRGHSSVGEPVSEPGAEPMETAAVARRRAGADIETGFDSDSDDGDSDSDSDDGDSDSDSDDGDSDSDSDT